MPRPFCGDLQHSCDVLVRTGGRGAEVPRAPVGIEIRVERLGERGVSAATIGRGGRVVDDGPDERMAERNLGDEHDEPACLGVRDGLVPRQPTDGVCGATQERRIAQPLGGRQQQHHPRRASSAATRDANRPERRSPIGNGSGSGDVAAELLDRQHPGQLDERQRVASRRGDDVVGDGLVDRSARPGGQQLVGLVSGQATQLRSA